MKLTNPLHQWTTCLLLMAAACCAPANAQSDVATEPELIRLKHAHAPRLATVVDTVMGVSAKYDERTNTVILYGPGDRQQARNIIAQLDIPAADPRAVDDQVRVYPLQHARATNELARTLSSLFVSEPGVSPVRTACDPTTNQLIARGADGLMKKLDVLVESLDRSPVETSSGRPEVQVRLVWLVAGLDDNQTRPVPDDMREVVHELSRIGISDLALVSQAIVRVSTNNSFHTRFTAELDTSWRIQFSGDIFSVQDDSPQRQINLTISGKEAEGHELSEIQTSISTVSGHFVVLGATPIHQLESVFVIQLMDL